MNDETRAARISKQRITTANRAMVRGGILGALLGVVLGSGIVWFSDAIESIAWPFIMMQVTLAMLMTGMWTGPVFLQNGHQER